MLTDAFLLEISSFFAYLITMSLAKLVETARMNFSANGNHNYSLSLISIDALLLEINSFFAYFYLQ